MLITLKQKLTRSKLFNRILGVLPRQILLLNPLEHIMIEPTNLCNLRCLFCTQNISSRPKGMMTFDNFQKIANMLPGSVKEVQLHFAGEPMLNEAVPEMIMLLKDHGIRVVISSNGTMPFERYEKAINAGLDALIISFDGATKESYEKYRQGGCFEVVVQNLKKMAQIPARKTELIIQFLVMRHNEHEIEAIKKLAKDLGVDTLWLKSASLNIGCSEILEKEILANAKTFLPENPKYSRYEMKDGRLINKDRPLSCPWIWRTIIMWNGDVGICCVDLEGKVIIGNVLKEGSFDRVWQSERYQQIRRAVLRREPEICQSCSLGDNPVKEVVRFNKG